MGERQTAFVALGSNLGEREAHLRAALAALRALPETGPVALSRVYETDPVGPGEQAPYLNAVARIETGLSPRALLEALLHIEASRGRARGPERNAPRTLDLDLLLYGASEISEPDLEVPHPRMAQRGFVLEPLCDLAPAWRVPGTQSTVSELAAAVHDPAAVKLHSPLEEPGWPSPP